MTPALAEHLAALNPEQHAAVTHTGSPLLILAGAGSGKTRVITTKIAYLIDEKGADPRSILAVTFTKKAATEMAERAHALAQDARWCSIQTFHSFGARFLRRYALQAGVDPHFTVYDDDDAATLTAKAVPALDKKRAAYFAHRIALAKDYCLAPTDEDLPLIEPDKNFPAIYAAYQSRLRDTGNVDFGDLIMLPALLLEGDSLVAAEAHRHWTTILVDEYQDSNIAQARLLKALAGPAAYVCVVGDDDQSIYHFRGAEVKNMLDFQKDFPATQVVRLERNYRSVSNILVVADAVVTRNVSRLGKTLHAERGDGKKPALVFLPNQDDETAFAASLVQQSLAKGARLSDWAILYRTNAQSLGFETEFLRRKIPYQVVGALKFYEREEIKDALSFLAFIANPRNSVALERIINKPARGIGAATRDLIINREPQERLGINHEPHEQISLLDSCRAVAATASKKAAAGITDFLSIVSALTSSLPEVAPEGASKNLSAFIDQAIRSSGLLDYHTERDEIAGTTRGANLQELANSAVPYPLSLEGLLDFLDHIELDRTLDTQDTEAGADAVTLITLHNTKGLEFPRVIITGLEHGIFPRQDKIGGDLEEERRLFYVGITRAKDELYLTSCRIRRLYGRTEGMIPSPFVYEILQKGKNMVRVLGDPPILDTFVRM